MNRFKRGLITVFAVIPSVCAVMQLTAFSVSARAEYVKPAYGMCDISPILEKSDLSDADYSALYRQTGLTRQGIDRCRARGREGIERIKSIQRSLFSDYTVVHNRFAPFCCCEETGRNAAYCYLENGDVLVSSSTHFSGCAMGHAGLVTDAARAEVLQANSYFSKSSFVSAASFTDRLNFMILSPLADKEVKDGAALYARKTLVNKSYGICSGKNGCDKTQCAHLVWYAYKQFGIDLDSDGGVFVTPKDIANSSDMRVVQAFGFDLDKLWK